MHHRRLAVCLLLVCSSIAPAQIVGVDQDPAVQQLFRPQAFEPGGSFFPNALGSRGSVIPSTRSTQVSVLPGPVVPVSPNLVIQSGSVTGVASYSVDLDQDHPASVHSPFSSSASTSGTASFRDDTRQINAFLNVNGQLIHPADGYDPPQGGGYPTPNPLGAIDHYRISFRGTVDAKYFQFSPGTTNTGFQLPLSFTTANTASGGGGIPTGAGFVPRGNSPGPFDDGYGDPAQGRNLGLGSPTSLGHNLGGFVFGGGADASAGSGSLGPGLNGLNSPFDFQTWTSGQPNYDLSNDIVAPTYDVGDDIVRPDFQYNPMLLTILNDMVGGNTPENRRALGIPEPVTNILTKSFPVLNGYYVPDSLIGKRVGRFISNSLLPAFRNQLDLSTSSVIPPTRLSNGESSALALLNNRQSIVDGYDPLGYRQNELTSGTFTGIFGSGKKSTPTSSDGASEGELDWQAFAGDTNSQEGNEPFQPSGPYDFWLGAPYVAVENDPNAPQFQPGPFTGYGPNSVDNRYDDGLELNARLDAYREAYQRAIEEQRARGIDPSLFTIQGLVVIAPDIPLEYIFEPGSIELELAQRTRDRWQRIVAEQEAERERLAEEAAEYRRRNTVYQTNPDGSETAYVYFNGQLVPADFFATIEEWKYTIGNFGDRKDLEDVIRDQEREREQYLRDLPKQQSRLKADKRQIERQLASLSDSSPQAESLVRQLAQVTRQLNQIDDFLNGPDSTPAFDGGTSRQDQDKILGLLRDILDERLKSFGSDLDKFLPPSQQNDINSLQSTLELLDEMERFSRDLGQLVRSDDPFYDNKFTAQEMSKINRIREMDYDEKVSYHNRLVQERDQIRRDFDNGRIGPQEYVRRLSDVTKDLDLYAAASESGGIESVDPIPFDVPDEVVSLGADFLPGIANLKSGIEALSGQDIVTGEELSGLAQSLAAIGIIAPQLKGIKAIKGSDLLKYLDNVPGFDRIKRFVVKFETRFTTRQLQNKWKHRSDFGITTTKQNASTLAEYQAAIMKHLDDVGTVKQGTYGWVRNSDVYFNPNTNLVVVLDDAGNYITGFKLKPGTPQYEKFISEGFLK